MATRKKKEPEIKYSEIKLRHPRPETCQNIAAIQRYFTATSAQKGITAWVNQFPLLIAKIDRLEKDLEKVTREKEEAVDRNAQLRMEISNIKKAYKTFNDLISEGKGQ